MASLSNINGKFAVEDTGAIRFSDQTGTTGQILKSNGNAAPTWVDGSTVIGGPYLPLAGGILTGATSTASGISFTVGGTLTANTGSKITSSSADTTFSIETTSGTTIFPILDFVSSHSSAGARIRVSGTDVISLDKSQNATFAGDITIGGKTYPKLNLTDNQGVARNFSVGTNNETFTVRNETASSDALTISNANNATFAGTVQATQITATNGLNYLKRNTDASLQLRSENTRSGLFITKPATDTVMGSLLVLADESYRLGTANYYHMYMLQNGNTYFTQNVGIGTTSPDVKIHAVASGTKISPLSGTVLGIQNNSSTSTNCWISALAGNAGAAALVFGDADDNDQARFQFNNSGRLLQMLNAGAGITIDSSGNVGIADNPSFKLDVNVTSNRARFKAATGDANIELSSIAGHDWLIQSKADSSFAIYDEDAAAERMRIDSSGRVGIGTSDIEETLTIAKTDGGDGTIVGLRSDASFSQFELVTKNSQADWGLQTIGARNMYFTTNGLERMRITSGGTIKAPSLGGYTPTGSDLRYDTSDGEIYYQTSSKRYKTDIVNLESSLDKINTLRPVRYKDINTGEPNCGLIAEETFEIIPEVVFTKKIEGFDEPQIEGLNYSDLVPFLIKSIQELKAEIEILKNK